MKPYERESKYEKYKAIADNVLGTPPRVDYNQKIVHTEASISEMKDVSEGRTNVILLSILLIPLCVYMIYSGSYWASIVLVAWVGAVAFYFVNERAITLKTLTYKSKIVANELVTKINHLLTWVTEKKNRILLMRTYNMVFWTFVLFMGLYLIFPLQDKGIALLLLLAVMSGNAFFWTRFYMPQIDDLLTKEKKLEQIKNDVIMASYTPNKNLKRYVEEEE